jgi:glucosamine-6-phosphate deaminase
MGLASIMMAKKIVLIATRENKAKAIQGLLEGLITEKLPCSILRNHPDVIVYLDRAAYSKVIF